MKNYLVLFFLLVYLTSGAQSPEVLSNLGERFDIYSRREFQEKVYLHTDKSHYVSGEHIWFRAYRTDATTHLPGVYSRFIYVELYNQREELVDRLKVMEKGGVFYGSFPLDRYLASGRYVLRAYTYWMQNFDESFYFRKEIIVENMQSPGMKREIRWKETGKGSPSLEFRFVGPGGSVFPGAYLDCRMYRGSKQVRKDIERADVHGWVRYPLKAADSVNNLRIQFLNKNPLEYQTTFGVPLFCNRFDVDVRFFPEGGYLLGGHRSQVNFKAIGPDGLGCEVYGCIYGEDDRLVTTFASSHRGMGRLELDARLGEHYYALVRLPDGKEKRVDLPEVQEEGVVLHAEVRDSVLHYACLSTPGYLSGREMYLLVHSRGKLLSLVPVDSLWTGVLPLSDLPAGIVQGVLLDAEGKVYSSRMSFVYPREDSALCVFADSSYGQRDSVSLSLCFEGVDSLSCSVAVTDTLFVPSERWGSNIVNYFLLGSDLKGHVESAGWYFDSSIPFRHRSRMLDILLGTQGWERFDAGKLCRGEGRALPFFLELSQGISGEIRNFRGKGARNPKLFVVVPRIDLLDKVDVDSNSRFQLNVQFPEKTTFVFQAVTSRNSKWVELFLDRDSLRPPQGRLFTKDWWREEAAVTEEDSVEVLDNHEYGKVETAGYYYENGRKVYMLNEAKVVRSIDTTILGQFKYLADEILEAHDIRDEKLTSLEEWIRKIPSVRIRYVQGCRKILYGYDKSGIDNKGKYPVYVYVNDCGLGDFEDQDIVSMLNAIPMDSIRQMGYIKERIKGGAFSLNIFIYLNCAYNFYSGPYRLDFMRCSPLGYHEPAEFYQPKYEIEDERLNPEPDERATLYWNPAVRLSPSQMGEKLHFYASDTGGPYRVIVEGITDKGEIIQSVKIIK